VDWIILVFAGLFEVVWAFSMKQSDGFTRSWLSVVTLAAALASFVRPLIDAVAPAWNCLYGMDWDRSVS
jgi:multidrug transporter EmrE-like cation transporter